MDRDLFLAQLDFRLGALEVVAGLDLASRLVERVHQLLLIEVADDIERDLTGHYASPSGLNVESRPTTCDCAHCFARATSPASSSSNVEKPRIRTRSAFVRRVNAACHEVRIVRPTAHTRSASNSTCSWVAATSFHIARTSFAPRAGSPNGSSRTSAFSP